MTTSEMIRELCDQQNITLTELARQLGQSRQNLFKKLKNNTLSHDELNRIGRILNVEYKQILMMPDGKQLEVVVDGDKETLHSKAIKTSLGDVYEELALIDPFTHTVKVLHRAENAPVESYFVRDDWDDHPLDAVVFRLNPEDREAYRHALSWGGLRSLMQGGQVFDLRFRIMVNNAEQHKLLRLTRVEKDTQLGSYEVLAAVSSRTGEQLQEQNVRALSESRSRLVDTITEYTSALAGYDNIDVSVNKVLGIFCRYFMGERAYILSFDNEAESACVDYEYASAGVQSRNMRAKRFPLDLFRDGLSVMKDSGVWYASRNDASVPLTEEAAAALDAQGVDAMLAAPLTEKGTVTGIWGVENPALNSADAVLAGSCAVLISELLAKKKAQAEKAVRKQENTVVRSGIAPSILMTEYTAAFHVDLVTGVFTPYSVDPAVSERLSNPTFHASYSDAYRQYVDTMVIPADRQMMLKAGSVGSIMAELRKKKSYVITYRSMRTGEEHYCQMKIIRVKEGSEAPDEIMVGFADKDNELRREIEIERKKQQDNEIIKILVSEYSSVYYVDLLTQDISVYTLEREAEQKLGSFLRSEVRYTAAYKICVDSFVYPEDREMMLKAGSLYNIINELTDKKTFSVTYRANSPTGPRYGEMKFVKVGDESIPQAVALGFADRHEEYMEKLRERQKLEARVRFAETKSRCIELLLNAENTEAALHAILKILCQYYACRHACIFEIDKTGTSIGISYMHGVNSGDTLRETLGAIPLDHFSGWFERFEKDGILYMPDLDDSLLSERQKELLRVQNISGFLAVPTYSGKNLSGFWGVDTQSLEAEDQSLLKSLSLIVSMALSKQKE